MKNGVEGGPREEKRWSTLKNERLGGLFIRVEVGDPPTT